MDRDISLQAHEFQLEVVKGIAELKTGQQAIVDHLARLNGSVAKHEERFVAVQQFISSHPTACPLGDRVEALEASRVASARTSDRWRSALAPLLYMAAGLVIALILQHGPSLVAALRQ